MSAEQIIIHQLQARVDTLESREAIRELAFDYCHGFDKRDYDRFLNIWWDDCVWDIGPPFGRFEGHTGVYEAIHEVLWPAWKESHHLTSNNHIRFETADRANSVCDVDCMGVLAGEEVCQIVGATYTDCVERRNGEWKISQRSVAIHYFNPVPGTVLIAPVQ
jgi:hypothetical protein